MALALTEVNRANFRHSGAQPRRPGWTKAYELASISSSLRWPGTMATGIGKLPAELIRLETSGPGPSLAMPAASTRMPMSVSSSISLTISSAGSPSRITRSGVMLEMSLTRAANLSNAALAASSRLGFHDVGDAQPLLIMLAGVDHAQHDQLRLGAAGALGRPIDRAVALLGLVDDDQIFALVAGLVAAAPLADHGRPCLRGSSRRATDEWWHAGRGRDKQDRGR